MKKMLSIVVLASAVAAAPVSAQQGQQQGQMISLEEAIAVTLTENPALKAAAYEERAAQQERRAAIGLRMPQINLTGAYTYMEKDIGVDFNNLKAPVKDLTGKILGSGIITDPALLQGISETTPPGSNPAAALT